MHGTLLPERDGQRTYVAMFERGEDAARGLIGFARREELAASSVQGTGGFERLGIGYFDIERKEYRQISPELQVEVVALYGSIARTAMSEPQLHIHVVVVLPDGTTRGGHLLFGNRVRPTLEVIVAEQPPGYGGGWTSGGSGYSSYPGANNDGHRRFQACGS